MSNGFARLSEIEHKIKTGNSLEQPKQPKQRINHFTRWMFNDICNLSQSKSLAKFWTLTDHALDIFTSAMHVAFFIAIILMAGLALLKGV